MVTYTVRLHYYDNKGDNCYLALKEDIQADALPRIGDSASFCLGLVDLYCEVRKVQLIHVEDTSKRNKKVYMVKYAIDAYILVFSEGIGAFPIEATYEDAKAIIKGLKEYGWGIVGTVNGQS